MCYSQHQMCYLGVTRGAVGVKQVISGDKWATYSTKHGIFCMLSCRCGMCDFGRQVCYSGCEMCCLGRDMWYCEREMCLRSGIKCVIQSIRCVILGVNRVYHCERQICCLGH